MRNINKKTYCLVVTDDFSRFSWVFFFATKDKTPEILKNFIGGIENQIDHKVKTIRCDNGTEFKNRIMNEFGEMTDTECVVLSTDFKLLDESQVLLKVPRNDNMYSFDSKNVVPLGGLTCLFAKATLDKYNLWHRRLGHIKFKTINKLVKGNLVRGLPSKLFENDRTCVACQKGKQHKAS
nr:putative ribonuclease H-like domain-containing protein [Tanacetum cinerariifolium]